MGVSDTWPFRDVRQRDASVDCREIAHALIEIESVTISHWAVSGAPA